MDQCNCQTLLSNRFRAKTRYITSDLQRAQKVLFPDLYAIPKGANVRVCRRQRNLWDYFQRMFYKRMHESLVAMLSMIYPRTNLTTRSCLQYRVCCWQCQQGNNVCVGISVLKQCMELHSRLPRHEGRERERERVCNCICLFFPTTGTRTLNEIALDNKCFGFVLVILIFWCAEPENEP